MTIDPAGMIQYDAEKSRPFSQKTRSAAVRPIPMNAPSIANPAIAAGFESDHFHFLQLEPKHTIPYFQVSQNSFQQQTAKFVNGVDHFSKPQCELSPPPGTPSRTTFGKIEPCGPP